MNRYHFLTMKQHALIVMIMILLWDLLLPVTESLPQLLVHDLLNLQRYNRPKHTWIGIERECSLTVCINSTGKRSKTYKQYKQAPWLLCMQGSSLWNKLVAHVLQGVKATVKVQARVLRFKEDFQALSLRACNTTKNYKLPETPSISALSTVEQSGPAFWSLLSGLGWIFYENKTTAEERNKEICRLIYLEI